VSAGRGNFDGAFDMLLTFDHPRFRGVVQRNDQRLPMRPFGFQGDR
jgi:hypothetical protein